MTDPIVTANTPTVSPLLTFLTEIKDGKYTVGDLKIENITYERFQVDENIYDVVDINMALEETNEVILYGIM